MWERLEAFWDGGRTLILGFFDADRRLRMPRGDLAVFSWADPKQEKTATLLDIIAPNEGPRHWIVNLPAGHGHVTIQSVGEGDEAAELQFALSPAEEMAGGTWRLLIGELPEAGEDPAFHLSEAAASANIERFCERQIAELGDRVMVALLQRRVLQRSAGGTRIVLNAAREVWPTRHARIVVEPIERNPQSRRDRFRNLVPAFSILELWLREAPPPVILRLSTGQAGGPADELLCRTAIVHVMHQRRHLREWSKRAVDAGDPSVDLLTFEDMCEALSESPDDSRVMATREPVFAVNLREALAAAQHEPAIFGDIRIGRSKPSASSGSWVEIDFLAAALGDDVGLVSNWAEHGDIVARPKDPGGTRQARLFRVHDNGLQSVELEETDDLFRELTQAAADHEIIFRPTRAGKERGNRAGGAASPGSPTGEGPQGIDAVIYAAYAAFAAKVGGQGAEEARKIGGYRAFRDDPALTGALMRNPELIGDLPDAASFGRHRETGHLARRLAALRRVPDVVEAQLTRAAQIAAWHVISRPEPVRKLAAARIALAGTPQAMHRAEAIAEALRDEISVQNAIFSLLDRGKSADASGLNAYLERRRQGDWTLLPDAASLADTMKLVSSYWSDFETFEASPQPLTGPADLRGPPELLESIRGLMARVRELKPPPPGLANLETIYRTRIENGQPDRFVLRNLESKLLNLIETPLDDELIEAVVTGLENWANLPNFARRIAPRLSRGDAAPDDLRRIVAKYVARVGLSIPGSAKQGGELDRYRRQLASAIEARLSTTKAMSKDRRDTVREIASYGDILLLHVAHGVIRDILSSLHAGKNTSQPVRRLQRYADTWPSRADSTWEQAVHLAETHLPAKAKELSSRLLPPRLEHIS